MWLEEVLTWRLPDVLRQQLPTDGSPWQLFPALPRNGGVYFAKLTKDGSRTLQTDFSIGPATKSNWKKANGWMPGPRSAALYAEWITRNGGTVKVDASERIKDGTAMKWRLPKSKKKR